jgi:dihydroflavonol-4-reductase
MKIAVTGANGHVGANLCRTLLAEGHQVKTLVHEHQDALNGLDIELIHGSVNDPDALRKLFKGVEVVFHLAALISIDGQKDKLLKVNYEGTKNLISIIRENGVRRLIHFSSIHSLKHFPYNEPMDETRPLMTDGPTWYEITKARAEKMVLDATNSGLDAIVINPTAIVGPNDFKPSLVGTVLIRLYKNSLPALVPGGYNWVDVRDVVQGAIAAMEYGRKGERYILGGKWVSVRDLAVIVEQVTNKKVNKFMISTGIARIGVPFIKGYAKVMGQEPLYTNESLSTLREVNTKISCLKAETELGYKPRSLEITIRDTMDWFRENGFLGR